MTEFLKPVFTVSLMLFCLGALGGQAGAQGLHDGGYHRIFGLRHIGPGGLAFGLGLPAAEIATDAAYTLYHRPYEPRSEDAYGQPYGAYGPYGY